MKSKTQICPFCRSAKVVKNGRKSSGAQNFLCKNCGKQFLSDYFYLGADPNVKRLIIRHLLRGTGVRDTAYLSGASSQTVLRVLIASAVGLCFAPQYRHYHKVQIDEQWSYVGKKKNKVWMFYAICGKTGEILAAVWGKRSRKTLKTLLEQLKDIVIDFYCTDCWVPFTKVFPSQKHLRGKEFTKRIEGTNTWYRRRVSRLIRRTTTFSKKTENHIAHISLAIHYRNNPTSFI